MRHKKDETDFKTSIWKIGAKNHYEATIPKVLIDRLQQEKEISILEGSKIVLVKGKMHLILKTDAPREENK